MAGVNVKMGVSGIQQFKQGMKESQAAVKTLGAELKLNEQQLKANGDAQQYMETKTKLLQAQIKAQTDVVNQSQKALDAMAKNGVKESSTAFQQMKQQSLAAQTQLVELQNQLNGVGESGSEAANDLSGIGNQLESLQRNAGWQNVAEGVEKITEKMQAAGKAAWEMGKKIVQATLSGGQWADDLATTATQWEMTPEQVYRMQQTANLIDTSAETIFSSRQKMIKAMGAESDKTAMGAFAALGISDLSGTEKNIEDVFWNAGEGLMQMEDKVARNEYAMKLFGRSWTDMIPIFQAGREAYEETYNSWTWMGDEQFDKLGKMNDEQMKLETEWEAFQHQFEAALAPALTEVMTIMQELMHEFNTYLQSDEGQKMLESLGEAVQGLFDELKEVKPEEVMEKIREALDSVREGLEWLIKNKDSVVTALKVIAGGFGLLKVTELAANIGRIVSGLGGLKGNGGTPAVPAGGGGGGAPIVATPKSSFLTKAGTVLSTTAAKTVGGVVAGLAVLFENAIKEQGNDDIVDLAGNLTEDAKKAGWYTDQGGALKNEYKGMQTFDVSASVMPLSDDQRQKAENYWDAWRAYSLDMSDENEAAFDKAMEELEASFEGQEELYEKLDSKMESLKDDTLDSSWTKMEDLPDKWFRPVDEMTDRTSKSTDDLTEAAKTLSGMPAEMYTIVENAIRAGMSNITFVINAGAVDTIGRRVGDSFGQSLNVLVP